MKRFLLSILIIPICLFTGCAKNYKTVSEYANDMANIRANLDYTVNVTMTTKGMSDFYEAYAKALKKSGKSVPNNSKAKEINIYYKTYLHGSKWKTEICKDKYSTTYTSGKLYDGENIYTYSPNSKYAMSIPYNKQDEQNMQFTVNPTNLLFNWDKLAQSKFGRNTTKNNFKCRIIKYDKDGEACISDKYGIAVYLKINNLPPYGDVEFNVTKISNIPLSDYDMELPYGTQKQSMEEIFKKYAERRKYQN